MPLADDFELSGPVASFDNAAAFRAMVAEAGQAVTRFEVRRQFVEGETVCSIIDWEMAIAGVGRMTSAELLEVAGEFGGNGVRIDAVSSGLVRTLATEGFGEMLRCARGDDDRGPQARKP